jgi:HEPN domain-containing protein
MDRIVEVKEWFDVADGDLRSAEHLMTLHYPRPDNVICNLCQQAAENYIKGFLVSKEIEFGKTHDLVALLELAKQTMSIFLCYLISAPFYFSMR